MQNYKFEGLAEIVMFGYTVLWGLIGTVGAIVTYAPYMLWSHSAEHLDVAALSGFVCGIASLWLPILFKSLSR